MARLTSPTGASVEVPDDKVANLLSRGFVEESAKSEPTKKAPKKSPSK